MKKRFIAAGLIVLITVSLLAVAMLKRNSNTANPEASSVVFQNAQLGITVDGWLKITEIEEYDGRLAVIAENVSDDDVEYALLTVQTKSGPLTFNVSALLKNAKAVLLCNEDVGSNPDEVYTAWQTKDKIVFEKTPVMNTDKIEVQLLDGSISVKNISNEDIESDVLIFYKDRKDDLVNGSVTYKVRIEGLKAGSKTFVKTPDLNESNCRIIFTDYDDNKV